MGGGLGPAGFLLCGDRRGAKSEETEARSARSGGGGGGGGNSRRPPSGLKAARPQTGEAGAGGGAGRGWERGGRSGAPSPLPRSPLRVWVAAGPGRAEHRGPLSGVCTRRWLAATTGLGLHREAGVCPSWSEFCRLSVPRELDGMDGRVDSNSVLDCLDSLVKFVSLPSWSCFLLLQARTHRCSMPSMSAIHFIFIFIFCCIHSCSMHNGQRSYT